MTTPKGLVLKPGKDKAVRNRHHWVFSGAVASLPADLPDGGIAPVLSASGELLGHAYVNRRCSILGRILSFGPGDPLATLERNLLRAIALRRELFGNGERTNAFRVVNAEGDAVPGLVADLYDSVLVVQIATLGMEKLKGFVLDTFLRELGPATVYERSDLPSRREEGLPDAEGLLRGEERGLVLVREDGLELLVDVVRGQKTGLYLDQRENRRLAGSLARGRTVLNLFAYTGAFSVHALRGGALRVDSVDSSAAALEAGRRNVFQNGFDVEANGFIEADVFEFLRGPSAGHDLVILDPPAFAKRRTDVVGACRGYKDINRLAIQKAPPGALLMTFSCSHFVDEGLFRQVVFEAAAESGRAVRILGRHLQAPDHPVNVFHPETEYLKGFLLYID